MYLPGVISDPGQVWIKLATHYQSILVKFCKQIQVWFILATHNRLILVKFCKQIQDKKIDKFPERNFFSLKLGTWCTKSYARGHKWLYLVTLWGKHMKHLSWPLKTIVLWQNAPLFIITIVMLPNIASTGLFVMFEN